MKIKALIVDDESIAREVLQQYLQKYCPNVECIGEAKNAQEAITAIQKRQPQLVFLDVEMPYGNAFDVLEATQTQSYHVIFVTAYSHYALKALNQSASYYILKPISIEALEKAVQKVTQEIQQKNAINTHEILLNNLHAEPEQKQIVLPTQAGFDIVQIGDIIRLQADGNFTKIFFKNGNTQLVCRFLKHFEEVLEFPFLRIHRSHMINLNCILSYHKAMGGYVVMADEYEVEVSTTYKQNLMDYFSSIG